VKDACLNHDQMSIFICIDCEISVEIGCVRIAMMAVLALITIIYGKKGSEYS
jgi:hypothetical protein